MSDLNQSTTPDANPGTDSTPISEARSAASRENGQKSHGPVTPEGKAKSRFNAVKCNLTGNHVLVTAEDAPRYYTHITDYQTQFQPIGPEECALVQSIADLRWRLNKIPGLEQSILVTAGAKLTAEDPTYAPPEAASTLEREIRLRHEKRQEGGGRDRLPAADPSPWRCRSAPNGRAALGRPRSRDRD